MARHGHWNTILQLQRNNIIDTRFVLGVGWSVEKIMWDWCPMPLHQLHTDEDCIREDFVRLFALRGGGQISYDCLDNAGTLFLICLLIPILWVVLDTCCVLYYLLLLIHSETLSNPVVRLDYVYDIHSNHVELIDFSMYLRVLGGYQCCIWIEECILILLLHLDFYLGKYFSLQCTNYNAIEFSNLMNFVCLWVFGGCWYCHW